MSEFDESEFAEIPFTATGTDRIDDTNSNLIDGDIEAGVTMNTPSQQDKPSWFSLSRWTGLKTVSCNILIIQYFDFDTTEITERIRRAAFPLKREMTFFRYTENKPDLYDSCENI